MLFRNLSFFAKQVASKKPNSTLPAASAVSALTGAPYPKSKTTELVARGFTSPVWLTEKQMETIGVGLKPGAQGKGQKLSFSAGTSCTLYNATQTTDPALIESLVGRLHPTNAITGYDIGREAAPLLLKRLGNFPTNEWVTEKQVSGLGLKLKPKARGVEIELAFSSPSADPIKDEGLLLDRGVTVTYYNVGDLENPEVVKRAKRLSPISASTGRKYAKEIAVQLLREALQKRYESPFWLTQNACRVLGLTLKPQSEGVPVSVASSSKQIVLFNADCTNNPSKVASESYKAQFQPRSAVSGALYPEPTSSELSSFALKNKFRSLYWLTYKQASFLGVDIVPGQKPAEVFLGSVYVKVYNADQTTNKKKVEEHATK